MVSMKHSKERTACYSTSNAPHLEAIFGSTVRLSKYRNKTGTRFHGAIEKKKKKKAGRGGISLSHLRGFL